MYNGRCTLEHTYYKYVHYLGTTNRLPGAVTTANILLYLTADAARLSLSVKRLTIN